MSTRGEAVTRQIRDDVVSGAFRPGARLNEVALAAGLGVSRTPVRSALSTLYAEGLLDYAANCGYVVRRFSAKDVADVFVVRADLEALVCRIAAEQGISEGHQRSLDQTIRDTEALLRVPQWTTADTARWTDLNNRLHDTLYAAGGNDYLTNAVRRTRTVPLLADGQYRMFGSHEIASWFDRSSFRRSHADHVDVVEAIAAREGTRAAAAMREHIARAGRLLARQWAGLSAGAVGVSEADAPPRRRKAAASAL